MLNSGKKNLRFARQKKNSNSCVVRKKFLNETKNHNPPFKLNGRSLRTFALGVFKIVNKNCPVYLFDLIDIKNYFVFF